MDLNYAKNLIKETNDNYNLLANDYSRTRAFVPQDIINLTEYALSGERVLDSGCANGRLFPLLKEKNIDYFGIDNSQELIKLAKNNYPQADFRMVDALEMSFDDNFFDKVFSISVIHHLPVSFQEQYLREIERTLKPGGLLILRVWDFWKRKEGKKLLFKYSLLKVLGRSKLDFYDVFVPWRNSDKKIIAQRYFHCFRKRSLNNLIKRSGFKIKKSWRQGKDPRTNIYIIAEKKL